MLVIFLFKSFVTHFQNTRSISFYTLICFGKYVAKLLNRTNQNDVDNRFRNSVYRPVYTVGNFMQSTPIEITRKLHPYYSQLSVIRNYFIRKPRYPDRISRNGHAFITALFTLRYPEIRNSTRKVELLKCLSGHFTLIIYMYSVLRKGIKTRVKFSIFTM